MSLVTVDIPTPLQMRGGWAAQAALYKAYGWDDSTYATEDLWFTDDGGGNYACIRFVDGDRAVLFGHNQEFADTLFGDAFLAYGDGDNETDLLEGAPGWWSEALKPSPAGAYIGFIYGWDRSIWQRAKYDLSDGFAEFCLLHMIKNKGPNSVSETIKFFKEQRLIEMGVNQQPVAHVDMAKVQALIDADAQITEAMLEPFMRGYNIQAGVAAAKKFLLAEVR